MSSLTQITWIEVDQTLRDTNDPCCQWWYLQTQYWMSIMHIRFIAYNGWLYEASFDLINFSVNTVSTIFGLASWITLRDVRWHQLIIKLLAALLNKNGCDNNATVSQKWELQRSVNNLWPCIMKDWRAVRRYQPIIVLPAAYLGKTARHNVVLCPENECLQSVNDFWPRILENPTAVRRHWPIIELLATVLGKNAFEENFTSP